MIGGSKVTIYVWLVLSGCLKVVVTCQSSMVVMVYQLWLILYSWCHDDGAIARDNAVPVAMNDGNVRENGLMDSHYDSLCSDH